MIILHAIIYVLALVRLTHLATVDAFPPIDDTRSWIIDRFGTGSWQAYLVQCPWCVSVWFGYGLALICWGAGVSLPLPWLLPLVGSLVTGLAEEALG